MQLLTLLSLLAGVSASAAPRLVVLDVEVTNVDASLAPTLTEILTTEVQALGTHEVIGGRDLDAVIGFERRKDLAGCDDVSCYSELAGALGADALIATQVGRIGDTYVVSLKRIDLKSTRVEARVSETVEGREDTLIATIRSGARRLFGVEAAPASPATNPARVVAEPPSTLPLGPVALGVVGAAAAIVGTVFAFRAEAAEARANDREYVGAQLQLEEARQAQRVAFLGLGAAALCAAGGVTWWILARPTPEPAAVGAAAEVGLTWKF